MGSCGCCWSVTVSVMQVRGVIVFVSLSRMRVLVGVPRHRSRSSMAVLMVAVIVAVPVRVHRRAVCVRVPVLLASHHPERCKHQSAGEELRGRPRLAQYRPR